jgi:GNAT superfamily N-acetyltransferase
MLNYAKVYELYEFRGKEALQNLPAGVVTTKPLPGELEEPETEWLNNAHLVLKLNSSSRRCCVQLGSAFQQDELPIKSLPIAPNDHISLDTQARLQDICKIVYGNDARMHVHTDLVFYCTKSGLRTFPRDKIIRVTRKNAGEVIANLANGGIAARPEYIDADYILNHGPAYTWYEDGRPIGFCGVHRSFMSDKVGNEGMVFVDNKYRGRGIARALVSAVTADLIDADRVPLYACLMENIASVKTAESVGFRLCGYRCNVYVNEKDWLSKLPQHLMTNAK